MKRIGSTKSTCPPGMPRTYQHRQPRLAHGSGNAFTMLELLVTLAVTSVLLVLMISSLAGMRQEAENTKCLSNLRTTGMAALRYFGDNNGRFFPWSTWDTYPSWSPSIYKGMRDYLGVETDLLNISKVDEFKKDTILTCPVMRRLFPDIRMPNHRCYSVNGFLYQKNHSSKITGPDADRPYLDGAPIRMANVREPSQMWMFTDASKIKNSTTTYAGSADSVAYAVHLVFPHKNRQNFVFLDGHTESLTEGEFLERGAALQFWGKLK